jgi:S-methylmethionine-dependent homocysteine/selenocysteine methylase
MRNRKIAILLVLAFMLAGCSWMVSGSKNFTDMTPKEKSTYFMGVYNKQFTDTMAMASLPSLSEDQKKVVRVKKDILTKAWPMITAYDAIAAGGGTPAADAEAAINSLIQQLILAGVK